MNTRSKRPAGSAPKTPSPKRSAAKSDDDKSPQCVAAAAVVAGAADDPADDRKIAATDTEANESKQETLEIVAVAGDDDDKTIVSGSNDSLLRREFDTLRESTATAPRSLMAILRLIPSTFNIFDPPKGSVSFVVYSAFVYFSPVVMRVIRTALLWYEHELNNQTNSNWPAENITVIVAESTEDMMSHAYVRDRRIKFLSIDNVNEAIMNYPPIKPTVASGGDIVTVEGAKLRDATEPSSAGFDGTAGSLRAQLLTPTNNRYVSWIFSIFTTVKIENITYSLTMVHISCFADL